MVCEKLMYCPFLAILSVSNLRFGVGTGKSEGVSKSYGHSLITLDF